MELSQQELYTILKGLNMISNTNETKLSSLEIFKLQQKIEKNYKVNSVIKNLQEYKTEWFIALAEELGHPVRSRTSAANGGEEIYFEGFSMGGEYTGNNKRNPYFMLWTGSTAEEWHAEFGHWYHPKNNKERKEYPTTKYYKEEDIPTQMKLYSQRASAETA